MYTPAPAASKILSGKAAKTIAMTIPTSTPITSVWEATRPAPSLSPMPMRRAIACEAPTPRPFPIPMRMKKNGNTTPVAASAAVPTPDTHMASTRLFRDWTSMPIAMGTTMAMSALFGSPRMFPVSLAGSVSVMHRPLRGMIIILWVGGWSVRGPRFTR